ncbi:MAG: phosphonate metabolism protein/1,5-bisphosphokinase (PRPP-forming) PhnN [Pseudolabrys sp.]|jgi:thymidine phosphorylase
MAAGTLFLVVGPSGVGKDTLLDGARAALRDDDRLLFARRTITRAADAGGEDHEAATPDEFARRKADGGFLLTWAAHGLEYGLPMALADALAQGRNVVANGSRATIGELAKRVPHLIVVEITAPPESVAARLRARGREDEAQVAARVARTVPPMPDGIEAVRIVNDADVATGIAKLVSALTAPLSSGMTLRALPIDSWRDHMAYLPAHSAVVAAADYLGPGRIEISDGARSIRASVHIIDDAGLLGASDIGLSRSAFEALGLPEGTKVTIERTPSPESAEALRAKLRGEELSDGQIRTLIGDMVEGRYPDREMAAFLVAATRGLSDREVVALARARADFTDRLTWDEPMVVDKHSMGGIPGSRITMIVVPLVAAHGLAIPKTSSRAITSAAGTADAMETLARVDLSAADVHRVVAQARGCVAWNGRLNHSAVDDVMNAITRPLGLDSTRWSVASILSKKLAAGSTHVIIDLPYGPQTKLKSRQDAVDLAALFERIGQGLGLVVEAHATNGERPIGRGVGPALEARDVFAVLDNAADAPADLRDKALFFTGRILAWDPKVASEAAGQARARELLASGAGRDALERIVHAQGRRQPRVLPGAHTRVVNADRSGIVTAIDGWTVAAIARRAGAPSDLRAGLDLLRAVGDAVKTGEPLYVIHAGSEADLAAAANVARAGHGYTIAG